MTFKHKLSHRLALLKDQGVLVSTAVLAAVAVFACEQPLQITDSGTSAVSRLVVSPKALALRQNQVTDFTAVGLTSTGDTASMTVSWSVTSGSITDTSTSSGKHYGRYKASSDTGKVKVVARGSPGGPSDTAVVTVTLAPVASVTVSPASASAQVGQTVQLSATTKDSAGNLLSGRTVTWASSSPLVATVSSSGLVTAAAAGAATITATSEGQTGTSAVTVTQVPVASLAVSPASASIQVGQTVQLTATPKDANGNPLSGRTVTWSSSKASVATVSSSGLVTAVAAGSATITATSEGQSGTAAITVTAPASNPGTVSDLAVAGVTDSSVTLSFTEVTDGTGLPASYDIRFAVGTISWGSATVVTRGSCASPMAGSAVGAKRSCTVPGLAASTGYQFQLVAFRGTLNVDAVFGGMSNVATGTTAAGAPQPVASVAVSPASASILLGQTVQLTAILKDANGNVLSGRSIAWASNALGVATVSASGLVTAVTAGSATITATSEGKSGTSAIAVTAPASNPGTVTDLTVSGVTDSSVTLSFTEVTDGTGLPASYDVRFAAGAISWGSATVVKRGSCASPMAGSAVGAKRSCTLLGLAASTGYQFQLVAFRGTLNLDAVFGGLSNVASGTTVGSTAPVASVTVTPASASIQVGQTVQLTATPKDANGNPLAGRTVTWSSSNTSVATVSSGGLVTGLAVGVATITATSEGQSGTAAISLTSAGSGPQPGPTATIIFQDGFESGNLSLWEQIPNSGRYGITTDPARVKSGTHSLQVLFTPTNTYGMITTWFMPGYDEIYVKFNVMFEEGFDESYGLHFLTVAGNRIDNSQSSFGKAATVPDGTDYFYAGVDPEFINGDAPLKPLHFYTYWPDMSCCYGNRFYQTAPKIPLVGGQWQEVVFHVKLNTPGQYDGSQTLWINGVKQIDVQNMRWRTTTDLRLNEIRFDNYMSQGPTTEHLWVDNVTVWRP